jgi:hypothetical protein
MASDQVPHKPCRGGEMTKNDFLNTLQKRIASGAVTPSAARNMGPTGTIKAARKFLADEISLIEVASSGRKYPALLDAQTSRLRRALPKRGKRGKHWGAARKFLNIFLRDATYNVYLRKAYRLDRIENRLEVPLDSHMADYLTTRVKELNLRIKLPPWGKVILVNKRTNRKYQEAAKAIARAEAKNERLNPVHLDVIAWRRKSGYY